MFLVCFLIDAHFGKSHVETLWANDKLMQMIDNKHVTCVVITPVNTPNLQMKHTVKNSYSKGLQCAMIDYSRTGFACGLLNIVWLVTLKNVLMLINEFWRNKSFKRTNDYVMLVIIIINSCIQSEWMLRVFQYCWCFLFSLCVTM